ncbi:MAG: ABC transporter permease [Firmicutes bacterium]|nr:ABC transporter permease [Bacillota bacterium]
MKQTWKIAKWEITRNLTNKQFIIGLLLTPLIFIVFAGLPIILEKVNQPSQVTYLVVDQIGVLPVLDSLVPEYIVLEAEVTEEAAQAKLQDKKAFAYIVIPENFIETGTARLVYNELNFEVNKLIETGLTSILQQKRLQLTDLDPNQLSYLTAQASLQSQAMEKAKVPGFEQIIVSLVFLLFIFMLIFSSGTMLMMSAVQERRDRMAEVVLSSIIPTDLMQGKILGHFILGLIQLIFWISLSLPAVVFLTDFPIWTALQETNLLLLGFFGIFGYLIFAALFVGMGATMEDLQSAGNTQGFVIMLPMLSMLFIGPVVGNPHGVVSKFASYFPFTSPIIMVVRTLMTTVPTWQILLSAAILILTTLLIAKMAAKIFRVGMLMHGKNATPKEIIKWLRYKDV